MKYNVASQEQGDFDEKNMSADPINDQSSLCVRCNKSIASSQVYELESKKWHDQCFTCYKCDKKLNADSDFLVLDIGTLICYDCSDKCTNCGDKIDDTAIILPSSNEAYCSNCFRCCRCSNRIKNLKYAKTKRGLCCMDCHEKLLRKKQLLLENQTKNSSKEDFPIKLPERSVKRPLSPTRINGKSDVSTNNTAISKNLVSSNEDQQLTPQVLVSQERDESSLNDNNDNDNSKDREETSSHARTVSIDDILNSTLEHDSNSIEEQSLVDNEDYINKMGEDVTYRLLKPQRANRDSIVVKDPRIPNSNSNANRFFSIYDKEETDKDDTDNKENEIIINTPRNSTDKITSPLNSPMAVQMNEEVEPPHGLALTLSEATKENNKSSQGIQTSTSKSMNHVSPITRTDTVEMKTSTSSSTLRLSDNGSFSRPQTADNLLPHKKVAPSPNKKLSRSFSLKSKNFVHNLKSKTSEMLDPKHPHHSTSIQESDTHSGWGVSSTHTNIRKSKAKKNPVSRGQSDSTIYNTLPQHENFTVPEFNHKKAQSSLGSISKKQNSNDIATNRRINGSFTSSSSGHHIAMFRTPPLESGPLFKRPSLSSESAHHRSSSLQTSRSTNALLEDDSTKVDATDESATSLEKDFYFTELTLRKLKLDVRELEGTKKKLLQDVENLRLAKERLLNDVDNLTREKDKQSASSRESLEQKENIATSITVKSPSSNSDRKGSISNASPKPRFWKIFSSAKDHQVGDLESQQRSPNSSSGGTTNIAQKEISSPKLIRAHDEFPSPGKVPLSPSPKRLDYTPDGSHLYGSSLQARCAYEKSTVPIIIRCCIDRIEKDDIGLNMEGLYRKSGSQTLVEEIENEFAQNNSLHSDTLSPKLNALLNQDIHAVASVLKRYLRKLPDPVLSFSIYDALIDLVRNNQLIERLPLNNDKFLDSPQKVTIYEMVLKSLLEIFKILPVEHQEVLKVLAAHIGKVRRCSERNLMNLHNLSLVFAPSLIHDFDGEKDIVDMKERNYIVEFILGNYRDIFKQA